MSGVGGEGGGGVLTVPRLAWGAFESDGGGAWLMPFLDRQGAGFS